MKLAEKLKDNVFLHHILSKSKVIIALGENPFETTVIMDTPYGDFAIGCIQDLLLHVSVDNQLDRKFEITFPKMDVQEWKDSPFPKTISESAANLESLGFVTFKFSEPRFADALVVEEEVFAASSDEDFERSLAMVRGQSEQDA